MSNQGLRQATFRSLGGTTGTYNEDVIAGCKADEPGITSTSFNGILYEWLGIKGCNQVTLEERKVCFANLAGVDTWGQLGNFAVALNDAILWPDGDQILWPDGNILVWN